MKIPRALIIGLLSISLMSIFPHVAFASNTLKILPSSAYVGMYRTILIDVEASDTAGGMWQTGVWVDASTVPTGVFITFLPAYVNWASSIKSMMVVTASPNPTAGTYYITVVAGWTTIIGQHWETRATFTLQVKGVAEGDWAQNPSLLLQHAPNPTSADYWYPGDRQWNWFNGQNWPVANSPNLYAKWNVSGRVDMMAKAATSGTIDQVAHFIQGTPEGIYQPPMPTLNPAVSQIEIKAAVTNIATNYPSINQLFTWTGIKFDAYAVSTKDGRTLYLELYFVRTGGNLNWESIQNPFSFRVAPSHNEVFECGATVDDYLAAIDVSSLSFNQCFTSIVTAGPTTWFAIDLSGFFQWAADGYMTWFPDVWDSSRSISDYKLTQVSLCLEANLDGGSVIPQCSISLENLAVKGSYLPDVNLDGKIDILDLVMISHAYGSKLGDSSYLPNADLNLDGKIDMTDLTIASSYFGKTFPNP
jgi:hypothetical protein